MNRTRKFELQGYYTTKICVCGSPKNENRWCCLLCMKMLHGSDEEKRLDEACNEHFDSVEAFLGKIKEKNKENRNGDVK